MPWFSLSGGAYSANKGAKLRPREGTFRRQDWFGQQLILGGDWVGRAGLTVTIVAIAWLGALTAPALALQCPRDPSLATLDTAFSDTALSSSDADEVRGLLAAMARSLAQDDRTAARRALFRAMAVMGWEYHQDPPRVRNTSMCPRGAWKRKD